MSLIQACDSIVHKVHDNTTARAGGAIGRVVRNVLAEEKVLSRESQEYIKRVFSKINKAFFAIANELITLTLCVASPGTFSFGLLVGFLDSRRVINLSKDFVASLKKMSSPTTNLVVGLLTILKLNFAVIIGGFCKGCVVGAKFHELPSNAC